MMLAEATGKANKVKMNNVSLIKYINDLSTSTLPGPATCTFSLVQGQPIDMM